MTDHNHLRELAQKATPGPWRFIWERSEPEGSYPVGIERDHGGYPGREGWVVRFDDDWSTDQGTNGAYIAAANPSTVLALLDENDRLREALQRLYDDFRWIASESRYPSLAASPVAESHGVGFVDKVGIECLCGWTCSFVGLNSGVGGWIAFNHHLSAAAPAESRRCVECGEPWPCTATVHREKDGIPHRLAATQEPTDD